MEKRRTKSRTTRTPQQSLDDLPTELMHRIQSLLSEQESARTCVLSKSWHHAWSTIPTLRFPHFIGSSRETKNNELVYKTIQRYHENDVPIETLAFEYFVTDPGYAKSCFRHVLSSKTRSCLKELSLKGCNFTGSMFTFADDLLFSGEKLQTIQLNCYRIINPGINPVIKCASLRVLVLKEVNISEDVFHSLLSTCSLLEEVRLDLCEGLKTIKVKNLNCLRQLRVTSYEEDGLLEIDNVPSLGSFYYQRRCVVRKSHLPFKTTDSTTASSLGRSVTGLHLEGMIIDSTFFDMIESKFPFLESLELRSKGRASKRYVITSPLKRLTLYMKHGLMGLQVYAPNLLSFEYKGKTLPTLLFQANAPKEIKLRLNLRNPVGTSFFIWLREVLNLSSKFDIHIEFSHDDGTPFSSNGSVDVDDLRKRVLFPVTNVQLLSLDYFIDLGDVFREHTRAFDAFFSIFHPTRVKLYGFYSKSLCKLTVRGMMENNMTDLKDVLIKKPS
uniref:putative F-box/LRR-repeat protein At5g02700 n=1 Tax=Erigeron canadensis TaxID=72917 RepID=UPI001CB896D5|nr:putative F-box/LRR-repeat protein At5g02700 [Erigeron canadensis]